MKLKFRLALLLMLIMVLTLPSIGVQAAYYPSFKVKVYDSTGSGAFSGGVALEVTGHELHAYVTDLMYAGSRYTIKWTSKKPSVASVNSKGVITCKKDGYAVIRVKVTNKTNGLGRWVEFTVGVVDNSASYTGLKQGFIKTADEWGSVVGSSMKVYQKGGNVYTTLYLYNGTDKTIKKSVDLDMSFTYDESASTIKLVPLGVRKVALAAPIPPHRLGKSKAINLGKPDGFNSKKSFLLSAWVVAASPTRTKGASGTELVQSLAKLPGGTATQTTRIQSQTFTTKGVATPTE